MKKSFILLIFLAIILGIFFVIMHLKSPIAIRLPSITKSSSSQIDHIVIIVMENESSKNIVGNSKAPFINSLIRKYSYADNYFSITHPSLPNYLALIGGDTFGITKDCTDCYISSSNLIDQLENSHKTWKAYMESMPSPCYVGSNNLYAQKHNPFIYFDNIRNNAGRCKNIVPYSQLSSDLQSNQTTPNFIWISPNLCHDMHDCSIEEGDRWLSEQVPLLLQSPAFTQQKSLVVITWDEGESSGDNKIPTIFIGNTVKQGYVSNEHYNHYSLLHTIENLWSMPSLNTKVQESSVIEDIFK